MTDSGLQGWSPDPFQVHEQRYFSGGRPTKLVRDGDRESYDEPPSDTYQPVTVAAAPAAFTADVPDTYDFDPGDPEDPEDPGRRRGPRLAALLPLLAAGAVAASMLAVHGSHSTAAPDGTSAAFVNQSAARTLGQQTASMTISGTVQAAGRSIRLTGTGQVNFTANAATLNTTYTVYGRSSSLREIEVNGSLYMAATADGHLIQLSDGRTWLQTPLPTSSSPDLTGSNPIASLSELEQQGSGVRALGTKDVGGLPCSGYAVSPSLRMVAEGWRDELRALGIPTNDISDRDLNQLRGVLPGLTITIWVDQHRLVREIGVSMQVHWQTDNDVSINMVTDFSQFGTPVRIVPPPAGDIASVKSFL
jgi:hypothetical protein